MLHYDERENIFVLPITRQMWNTASLYFKRLHGKAEPGKILNVQFPAILEVIEPLRKRFPQLLLHGSVEAYKGSVEREGYFREKARNREPVTDWQTNGFPRVPPYDHQWAGVAWLYWARAATLGDDMGLGKTMQLVNGACAVMVRQMANRVVVVCPNSVKENWRREIDMHGWGSDTAHRFRRTEVPSGSTAARSEQIQEWAAYGYKQRSFLVLNYEALRYFPSTFLSACERAILICDEAHRLKSAKAKQSEIVAAARPARLWLATGTPVANRLEDLWHLSHLTRPGLMHWTFYAFMLKHIKREKRFNRIVGYKDTETVKRRWSMISMGRRKEDCLDLPEKVFEVRTVDLSGPERKAYTDMKENLRAELTKAEADVERGDKNAVAVATHFATRMLRLRQIADGCVAEEGNRNVTWSRSLTKLREAITTWDDAGRPRCVIWAAYVPVTERLAALGEDAGVYSRALSGKVKVEERQKIVDEWEQKPGAILSCQMDAMGEGWNGQAAAFQIFVDVPFTPKQRLQCIDRLHRIGQKRSVTIIDIIANDTLDGPLSARLDEKVHAGLDASSLAYSSPPSLAEIRHWLRNN